MYIKYIVIIVFSIAATAYALLQWGSPQWSKHIYLFQISKLEGESYIFTESRYHQEHRYGNFDIGFECVLRPKNFTGLWVDWDSDGSKLFEMSFLNGERHGKGVLYRGGEHDGEILMDPRCFMDHFNALSSMTQAVHVNLQEQCDPCHLESPAQVPFG